MLLTYFMDDMISERERTTIDGLLRNPIAIWGSSLPAEWIQRRRDQHPDDELVFFDGTESAAGNSWAEHHNQYMHIELLAQAFQMSAEVRRRATDLFPPERLQMLYRLQSGSRTERDVEVLKRMKEDIEIFNFALSTWRSNVSGQEDSNLAGLEGRLRQSMRIRARDGDHSREGLDARRREVSNQAIAVAAGRQAMQTGSQALFEQMAAANQPQDNEGTRAAYHRLHANGFTSRSQRGTLYRQLTLSDYLTTSSQADSDSDSDSDKDVAASRGLDARDSGRPQPKTDEELTVQMECKICYTQLAEVACLPCGHLVMCRWCSDQHSPCLQHDRTRPRRPAACPMCRKGIRQKVKVYRA
jgi:hypothetical protein